ncbi:MAG: tetratricopeptide repeat protein [Elusimicrobiota bacterium]
MRRHLWPVLLILGAVVAVYSNALKNGFVWDDHVYIESNAFVQDPANLRVLLDWRYYLGTHEVLVGQRPVFLASLMADRALWGDRPAGYHATSVILHGANSVWVYALSAALALPPPLPLLAGLFFGLHPIQTEAVDLVSFRAELLAAFFFLFSLWVYLKTRSAPARCVVPLAALCALLFGLALLSKETAATLPAMVLLLELYFPEPAGRRLRLTGVLGGFAVVACLYAGFWAPRFHYAGMAPESPLRSAVDRFAAAMPTAPRQGELKLGLEKGRIQHSGAWEWNSLLADRPAWTATMVKSAAGGLRLLAWPEPLVADRAPLVAKRWSEPGVIFSAALLLALALYAWLWRARRPVLAFAAAWGLVALLPSMNFIPLYIPMAERYLYLVTAGAAWAAASAICRLASRPRPLAGRAALLAAVLLAAGYGLKTRARNYDWRSDKTLFLSSPEDAPRSSMARCNRGDVLRQDGRHGEAVREYAEAVRLRPAYAEAWLGLGAAYGSMGDLARAAACHEKALALAPDKAVMSLAYAIFLTRAGQKERAAALYRRALALEPELAKRVTLP